MYENELQFLSKSGSEKLEAAKDGPNYDLLI
jgi:hypothetical protein